MKTKSIKTIVVDDESRIRRGIEKLVLSCGEEWEIVATYSDGKEVLEAYEREPFTIDVLITDVKMPVIDGLSLIKELKKRTSFSPIVISGFDDFSYLQTALREGALDYIMKPIDRTEFKEQLEKMKKRIWEKHQQQEELMYSKQIEKLNEITQGYDIDLTIIDWTKGFPLGSYVLMYVTIDAPLSTSMSKGEWDTWIVAHDNILQELISGYPHGRWKWRGEGSSCWVLFNAPDENNEEFKVTIYEMSKTIQDRVKANTPISNSIAISQIFTELAMLQTVSRDVLELVNYRLIFGESILQLDREELMTGNRDEPQPATEWQQSIQRIISSFESMNKGELSQHIRSFSRELQRLQVPSEIELYIKSLGIQMAHFMLKNVPRLHHDLVDIHDTEKLLKNRGSFEELEVHLEQWVMNAFGKLQQIHEERVYNQVEVAKEWVLDHLHDSITIEKMAKQVYMNPTYFCEYFKSQTGETVLDFVTRTRINKARELLMTTNLKVYEIAQRVGYADTKYFSKLFKKYYGELPSKYVEKTKLK